MAARFARARSTHARATLTDATGRGQLRVNDGEARSGRRHQGAVGQEANGMALALLGAHGNGRLAAGRRDTPEHRNTPEHEIPEHRHTRNFKTLGTSRHPAAWSQGDTLPRIAYGDCQHGAAESYHRECRLMPFDKTTTRAIFLFQGERSGVDMFISGWFVRVRAFAASTNAAPHIVLATTAIAEVARMSGRTHRAERGEPTRPRSRSRHQALIER